MDRGDGGPISPGKWSEPLIELAKGSKDATLQSGGGGILLSKTHNI